MLKVFNKVMCEMVVSPYLFKTYSLPIHPFPTR